MAGYSGYRAASTSPRCARIADEVGATLMVDMAHFAGLVAPARSSSVTKDPIPFAHLTTTTTTSRCAGRAAARAVPARVRRLGRPRVPDGAGRPAGPRDGGQGRSRSPRPAAGFQVYAQQIADNAKRSPTGLMKRGSNSSPAAPTTTSS
jgi:glycine/serine hydroxymethyltransferase